MSLAKEKRVDEEPTAKLAPEMDIKHPLQNTWSMWYFKNAKTTKRWEDNLIEIASFATVEDFWALYNHLELASKLGTGCDYAMFKTGIKPMWEDRFNRNGGRWIANLPKSQQEVDGCWLELLLCLVGEAFDEVGDDVCGAVVQIRGKADKVSLWTADVSRNVDKIGAVFKNRLRLQCRNGKAVYEPHSRKNEMFCS